jgi:hypothetical protein
MRNVMKGIMSGVLATLVSTAFAAEGAQGMQQGMQQGACKADAQKLCADVQPGEGRLLECLKTHQADLSPGCAGNMKKVQAAVKQTADACEADIEHFCFDTPIGKGGIASCLKKHSAELSPDCKAAAAKAKSGAKAK